MTHDDVLRASSEAAGDPALARRAARGVSLLRNWSSCHVRPVPARPLAAALGRPLLSKDIIKDSVHDSLGESTTTWSSPRAVRDAQPRGLALA